MIPLHITTDEIGIAVLASLGFLSVAGYIVYELLANDVEPREEYNG